MDSPTYYNEHEATLEQRLEKACIRLDTLRAEISRVLVGQESLVDGLLVGLLCNGHILLEGVPGLAKTLAVKALSGALDLSFSRLQFTPDLLPADLLGTMIYHQASGEFRPKLGPVFANLILADEINRAPAKVQSALLEAMQERQVTLGDTSHPLPQPFLVLATQNPIEQEGTYPLPEAQMDRFLLKVLVDYPSEKEELTILQRMGQTENHLKTKPVFDSQALLSLRTLLDELYLDESIARYIVSLVRATRSARRIDPKLGTLVRNGASPRATLSLALAARARALLQGRHYVTPNDVRDMATPVLRHRLLLSFEALAEGLDADRVIWQIIEKVPVP